MSHLWSDNTLMDGTIPEESTWISFDDDWWEGTDIKEPKNSISYGLVHSR